MSNNLPAQPKIYHIVHFDKLPAILSTGGLLCDAEVNRKGLTGTTIGMNKIKERRLSLKLNSHPGLMVGDCVPFYFCPRSVMLYMFSQNNHSEIKYRGGQEPIVHLVADLYKTIQWALSNNKRWAFTLSNAGAFYFEDRANIAQLSEINWDAVQSTNWKNCQDKKQAEFLIEKEFPWHLVEEIGVYSDKLIEPLKKVVTGFGSHPLSINKRAEWYY